MGNIVNRVFDSSGPEGKVRGTPQQIIDKYMILARDAQLSNDRVAAENFLQHAEHYTRMLGEAQRELQREADSRREQHEAQQGGYRDNRDRNRREAEEAEPAPAFYTPEPPRSSGGAADVIDFTGEDDADTSVLVETPESRPSPPPPAPEEPRPAREPRSRVPRPAPEGAPRSEAPAEPAPEAEPAAEPAPEGEAAAEKRPRSPRRRPAPRKPRSQGVEATGEAKVGE